MGKVGHDTRIALDGVGEEAGGVQEALLPGLTLIFCRRTRDTFAKPRKVLDKVDPKHSGFRNKDRHTGEG